MTDPLTTDTPTLGDWGWDERWALEFAPLAIAGFTPARVIAQHRGAWIVVADDGDGERERAATPTGKFRHQAGDGGMPAVGDWVACTLPPDGGDARIESIVARRSAFRRRAVGSQLGAQLIAANVDTLFVATSLNGDLNPRRLERYVAMGRDSGVEPVVLLTKSDLVEDAEETAARLASELDVAAVALSSVTGDGIAAVESWFRPGRTLAVVGSSGVGKSTLLNRLAGELLMLTRAIRDDDARGRHTTTHRELFRLPGGALMLDTPGMRELGLWDAEEGVEATFSDIATIAATCRFADCRHDREPGCAVRAAIETGEIDAKRLRSYRKLSAELADLPPEALRRERSRQFHKMVRNASADAMARKLYRG